MSKTKLEALQEALQEEVAKMQLRNEIAPRHQLAAIIASGLYGKIAEHEVVPAAQSLWQGRGTGPILGSDPPHRFRI